MNQYREDVILTSHDMHVVLKFGGVDIHTLSRQYADDIVLQSVVVHLDVGDD